MPFTERDLRAMLEENSSGLPPTGDLAAAAEHRGRRVRRRRHAAGAVAAAALVAVGFAVVPSLRPSDGPAAPLTTVASSQSPATPAARPDVDLSLLKKRDVPLTLVTGIGNVELTGPSGPEDSRKWVQTEGNKFAEVSSLDLVNVIGTVEGFELADKAAPEGVKERTIFMKVRPDLSDEEPADLERLGLREGETAAFAVGVTDPASYPLDELNRAVPAGTRVMLFEYAPGRGFPRVWGGVRLARSAVLEDADGTIVGGPYTPGLQPGVWQRARTFDELVKLVGRVEYTCALLKAGEPRKVTEEEVSRTDHEMKRCIRVPRSSPTFAPAEISPAVPEPTPAPS